MPYTLPSETRQPSGSIEVITGSMFSGKTEELIRRMRRAILAKQRVELFKPLIDNRYHPAEIVSHDARSINSTPVKNATQILLLAQNAQVVGIDEAQFFDKELINVCNTLAGIGIRVIVAGLDMDYSGKPFGPIPELMAVAEHITKVHAVCIGCGNPALFSHRTTVEKDRILLGASERYLPLCRACFIKTNAP
jgi:thymidine kinase